MFNQLTPSDVVRAIGATARDAARGDDRASDFARDQLLSAYSATRHLAAELSSYAPEFDRFVERTGERVRAAAAEAQSADHLQAIAQRLDGAGDTATVAVAVSDLLAQLRDDTDPVATALQADLRRLLRELADREVDILADALS